MFRWGSQILETDGWKSKDKTGKTVIFPEIAGKIVPIFALEGQEAPFLHVLDPNSPSIYVKCPRKCRKTYNFDIFLHFRKFTPLPLLNFGMNPKFDHIPYGYIIKVTLCKV